MLDLALTLAAETGDAAAAAAPLWSLASLAALLTLTTLEIVLGIDNIVFIAIVTQKLPEAQRAKARQIGLLLAMGMRIALLLGIVWVLSLDKHELFHLPWPNDPRIEDARGTGITGKDLVLLLGGLFLIAKSTWEIRHQVTPHAGAHAGGVAKAASFGLVVGQILMLDLVFSLDSVITAAGMTKQIEVMIAAVVIAVGVMLAFAGPVSRFVERHPSLKILALSFLVMIGVLLVAEGLHQHFERGYVYFAMAFALLVDLLQMRSASAGVKGPGTPAAGHP